MALSPRLWTTLHRGWWYLQYERILMIMIALSKNGKLQLKSTSALNDSFTISKTSSRKMKILTLPMPDLFHSELLLCKSKKFKMEYFHCETHPRLLKIRLKIGMENNITDLDLKMHLKWSLIMKLIQNKIKLKISKL